MTALRLAASTLAPPPPPSSSSLAHRPAAPAWAFDASVAACFDDMLRRSIPEFPTMRDAVLSAGAPFVRPRTFVVDLGASDGGALEPFVERFGAANRYHAVEIAPAFADGFRRRFAAWERSGLVSLDVADLRERTPVRRPTSLALAVLTLQFLPLDVRDRVLRDVRGSLVAGGALVVVEKLRAEDDAVDALLVERYHALKAANGYTAEAIAAKAAALHGVLVARTAAANEAALWRAGFSAVECVWRWMNFAAWLAVA